MSGFMQQAPQTVQDANTHSNNAVTLYGAADAFRQTSQWAPAVQGGLSPSIGRLNAATTPLNAGNPLTGATKHADDIVGLGGNTASKFLGHAGGALAGLGLANDIYDMTQNGFTVDNTMSGAGNALGVGSWAAGTFGAAGGGLSTVAAPLMAAGAGGLAIGGLMNSIADSKYALDENGQGTDDRWQQGIIDRAIANGEDPSSFGNVVLGGLAGTAGQIVDVGKGIGGALGAAGSAVWSAVTGW